MLIQTAVSGVLLDFQIAVRRTYAVRQGSCTEPSRHFAKSEPRLARMLNETETARLGTDRVCPHCDPL